MVDGIQDLISAAVQVGGLVLAGVSARFVRDQFLRGMIDQVITRGVEYAIGKIERVRWTDVSTRNTILDLAASYVLRAIPGALRRFGITPERLRDMVLARVLKFDKAPGNWSGDEIDPPPAASVVPILSGKPRASRK